MAKRPKYSRWRRLPRVFRSGEFKLPTNTEPQRLTLYIPDDLLASAEVQAVRSGVETVQEYCADMLCQAIEAERVREQVAEVEAKRGRLEGLHAIADDPEYLAEWSAQVAVRGGPAQGLDDQSRGPIDDSPPGQAPRVVVQAGASDGLSPAARVILHHAGQEGDDPLAFLPCLRRGESISLAEVAELARALQGLESEMRDARVLDRRVVFALHRLAYESQVLHTDAWPGAFDEWTVDALRAVQEAVERILSGQDIRYSSPETLPEDPT